MIENEDIEVAPPRNRMAIAVLSLGGLLIATYMLLYKLNVLSTLACGSGGCETVQSSPWAVFIGIPVPAWGVGGYLALLAVSVIGLQPQFANSRPVAVTLLAMATFAFGFSAYLTAMEAFRIHAWCRFCIASAIVATLIFLATLPEARRLRS